ncbi:uncharacterized protein LOC144639612 isoform X1 [Oculina patagonica]
MTKVLCSRFEINYLAVLLLSLLILADSQITQEDKTVAERNTGYTLKTNFELENKLRPRRSVVSGTASKCYLPFFVNGQPPIGFRNNDVNIRYICQTSLGNPAYVYATMFDLSYGIPIYSAYFVTKAEASHFGAVKRTGGWHQEKGIPKSNQGSTNMYRGVPFIHKGHLLPAETFSFTKNHLRSTFTYTNAVPQYAAFNSGQWAKYEKKIRKYATNKCSVQGGTLYLLTGISEVRIQTHNGQPVANLRSDPPKRIEKQPNIVIPNSMWTAGCCVHSNGAALGAFALIGNNDQNTNLIHMSQVKVIDLQHFLHVGVKGVGSLAVHLFPGNRGCSYKVNHVNV